MHLDIHLDWYVSSHMDDIYLTDISKPAAASYYYPSPSKGTSTASAEGTGEH